MTISTIWIQFIEQKPSVVQNIYSQPPWRTECSIMFIHILLKSLNMPPMTCNWQPGLHCTNILCCTCLLRSISIPIVISHMPPSWHCKFIPGVNIVQVTNIPSATRFLMLWSRRLNTWRNAKLRGANLLHRNLLQMPKTTGDAERGIESVSPVYFMNLVPSVYLDTFIMEIFKHLLCSFIMANWTYQVYSSTMQIQ